MKALKEKHLAQVADNLSYFNDCKTSFAISECKSWINKIFDDVEALQQPKRCDGCGYGKTTINSVICGKNGTYKEADDYCKYFKPKEQ